MYVHAVGSGVETFLAAIEGTLWLGKGRRVGGRLHDSSDARNHHVTNTHTL